MSKTPRVDQWWNAYRSGAITPTEFKEAIQGLEKELNAEKADHADTQHKWNDALDLGIKCVKQRDAARTALEYWRDECTFREPSLSLAQRMTDEALAEGPRPTASHPDYVGDRAG